jgi:hypothetical protein
VNLTATSVPSYWFIPSSYIYFFFVGFSFRLGRRETWNRLRKSCYATHSTSFPFLTWKSFLKFYFLRRLNIGDLLPRPVVVGLEMKRERELKFLWNMCQHTRIWIAVEMFHIGLKKKNCSRKVNGECIISIDPLTLHGIGRAWFNTADIARVLCIPFIVCSGCFLKVQLLYRMRNGKKECNSEQRC